jgi:signal transduction histidine kinase
VKSLRQYVIVGAALWTLGLLAVWAVVLTFHHEAFQGIAVIHRYPHTLMVAAIVAMLLGLATVGRGIAPLNELRQRLSAVRAGTAHRVDGRYPREVQPLVGELNALLAHQEQAVSRAQAKAGDLAHGLKTPLAILTHEAERVETLGQPDLASGIYEQIARMRRQIEYHLAHARAAASAATPGARSSLSESAEALARTMRRLYADRQLTIDDDVDRTLEIRCERADLEEMLGNLLDNACKWARSRVRVSAASPVDGHVAIAVDDDGPGIAPSLREQVLQRGVRADQAAPGSGFGLAIVRDLAELYGGGVAIGTAPVGGVSARLTLPAAVDAAAPPRPGAG